VDVLLETREAGLYLFSIQPSREFSPAEDHETRVLEWLVSGDLACQGVPVPRHSLTPAGAEGSSDGLAYANQGVDAAVLFRCICPPLLDAGPVI
jgi:hypothetical protein